MSENTRVNFDLSPEQLRKLHQCQHLLDASSQKEVVRRAINLLHSVLLDKIYYLDGEGKPVHLKIV